MKYTSLLDRTMAVVHGLVFAVLGLVAIKQAWRMIGLEGSPFHELPTLSSGRVALQLLTSGLHDGRSWAKIISTRSTLQLL